MSKLVKIQVLGGDGNPLANQLVALSGHGERDTNSEGLVQFLTDDISDAVLQIGTAKAWSGSTTDLKSLEVFKQSSDGFNRN